MGAPALSYYEVKTENTSPLMTVVHSVKEPSESRLNSYLFGMTMQGRSFTAENSRYGFTGKERDPEWLGGNAYDFGARMLDPRVGRWFMADPLARAYIELSPYCYVANNPIIATDPDGKKIMVGAKYDPSSDKYVGGVEYYPGKGYTGEDQYIKDVFESLDYLYNSGAQEMIVKAVTDEKTVYIVEDDKNGSTEFVPYPAQPIEDPSITTITQEDQNHQEMLLIYYDAKSGRSLFKTPYSKIVGKPYAYYSPARVLSHELGHFVNYVENPSGVYIRKELFGVKNTLNRRKYLGRYRDLEEKVNNESQNKMFPNDAQRTESISSPAQTTDITGGTTASDYLPGITMQMNFQGSNISGAENQSGTNDGSSTGGGASSGGSGGSEGGSGSDPVLGDFPQGGEGGTSGGDGSESG